MSKYHVTRTSFRDRECLVAALEEMGYSHVEVHEQPQTLYGYHGDARPEKGNVIVRRKYISNLANDVAWVWNEETKSFDGIISEFDSGKHNATWLGRLTAKYAERKVLKTTKALGFTLKTKPVRKNGKLVLEVIR